MPLPNDKPNPSQPWITPERTLGTAKLHAFTLERRDAFNAVLRKVFAPILPTELQERVDVYWDAVRKAERAGQPVPDSKELDAAIAACPHRDADPQRLAVMFCYLLTLPSRRLPVALGDIDALFEAAGEWRNGLHVKSEEFKRVQTECEAEAVRWCAEWEPQGDDEDDSGKE